MDSRLLMSRLCLIYIQFPASPDQNHDAPYRLHTVLHVLLQAPSPGLHILKILLCTYDNSFLHKELRFCPLPEQ